MAAPSVEILGHAIDLFWVGMAGSAAVEVVTHTSYYDQETPLPAKYGKPGFYISKLVLCLLGGALVEFYGVTTPMAAFHIGASASAIVIALSRKEFMPPAG